MVRKKKSRSSNLKESPAQEKVNVDDSQTDVPPEDYLDARLVRPPSIGGSRDSQKDNLVFLTEQDAYRIDVINGDSVLLLSRDSTEIVAATAVCSVRINLDGSTPKKLASPSGKAASGRQIIRLSQGSCRVSPSVLAAYLSLSEGESSLTAVGATPPTTPIATPSSQSPSKKPFSFAQGGGGDLLISPLSQPKTPQSSVTPSRSLTRGTWVIPLQCPLGERLSKMAYCDAYRVSFHLPSDRNEVTWSKSQRVLQRLVLASHVGRFVHEEDTIGISFQGKGLELKVERVEMEPRETMDELICELTDVDIDQATTPETEMIKKALRRGLQEGERRSRIRLYKLTHATEIVLLYDKMDSSEKTDALQESKDKESRLEVAGLDTTLHQVISLLSPPLMRSDLFRNYSLRPPRGVLLHGPSGCGKSLLAHQVKLDLESDVHVRTINCTSLQSRTAIVGEAERHLTHIFQSAAKNHEKSGTLLIFDDIHLICPKRGGTNEGADRLAATLLALLDGIGTATDDEGRGNLVILGITSNPSLLDPALRRPGRLDSEVEVPIPDEVARAEIIKFHLERLGLDVSMPQWTEKDFMALSRLAKGFNGADVLLAIKEALRKAIAASSLSSIGVADSKVISLTRSHLEASIRASKPSTISSITVEIPQVHWTSIGGMDDVKQKLRESIELPITHAHLFEALNIPPPRGVLLYGPPGCSKTLMARALATEGRMNFLAVKGPELLSKWLGESERALASLFRRARMASPCIIFFDEIDAIASKRGEGSAGGERLLSQLLTELDGISSGSSTKPERVIVVGATNRPDLLDSALTRPGRIDRMIYVGLPDETSRAHIFEIGLKGKACSNDIQVSVLASDAMSGGFSGAELIAICREAALLAIEEDDERMAGSPHIAMRHLTRAIAEMQRQITPEMLDFYASFHTNKI